MDTSKLIYSKSKEYLSKGNKFWIYHIDFIKKILGINVFTFVTLSLEQISFYILSQTNPNHLLFRYVFKLNSYSENSINAFVKLIKKIVSELEFDKLIGVFISKTNKYPKPLFFDEFGLDYIDKNLCIGCSSQTTLKLKCEHFCCFNCFENILINNECSTCKKKSLFPINQFTYYQLENIEELIFIKKWINSNDFFPNLNFNLGYNLFNTNNYYDEDYEDEEDEEDYEDEEEYDDEDEEDYDDEDEENWIDLEDENNNDNE